MDPACDVMLAYKQGGRFLEPDHGFPIRMIIPGHIGGRMVKWLEEIRVAPEESQNFYHFHDNRVLPPGVDQEKAKAEGAPHAGASFASLCIPVLLACPPSACCQLGAHAEP